MYCSKCNSAFDNYLFKKYENNLMEEMGNKITVLYISNQGGGAPKSLLNMIRAAREWVHPIVLFENDWYDYRAFVAEGIECLIVPYRMNMVLNEPSYKTLKWRIHRFMDEYTKNRMAPYRVAHALKGRRIDIVHTNTGAITIGLAVAHRLGAKHVWHLREFQDVDFDAFPYCGWDKFHQQLAHSDVLIGITHAIAQHFRFDLHPNAHVLWNAVRGGQISELCKEKEPYVLYCSSMIVQGKGLHCLLEAYAASNLSHKGIRLKVVGTMDEGYSPTIRGMIAKHHLKEHVDFMGQQSDVKPFMEKALCFVLPSLNEGLGRVVIEAMFYGCPVIVRNAGGPREYVKHGENGFFFNSTEELTLLLNQVVDTDLANVARQAQKFAVTHFSEENYGEQLMAIYQKLL